MDFNTLSLSQPHKAPPILWFVFAAVARDYTVNPHDSGTDGRAHETRRYMNALPD